MTFTTIRHFDDCVSTFLFHKNGEMYFDIDKINDKESIYDMIFLFEIPVDEIVDSLYLFPKNRVLSINYQYMIGNSKLENDFNCKLKPSFLDYLLDVDINGIIQRNIDRDSQVLFHESSINFLYGIGIIFSIGTDISIFIVENKNIILEFHKNLYKLYNFSKENAKILNIDKELYDKLFI